MANVYSKEHNERSCFKKAMTVYLDFRTKLNAEESKQKTIEELVRCFNVSTDFAKQAVSQMWN